MVMYSRKCNSARTRARRINWDTRRRPRRKRRGRGSARGFTRALSKGDDSWCALKFSLSFVFCRWGCTSRKTEGGGEGGEAGRDRGIVARDTTSTRSPSPFVGSSFASKRNRGTPCIPRRNIGFPPLLRVLCSTRPETDFGTRGNCCTTLHTRRDSDSGAGRRSLLSLLSRCVSPS